MHTIDVTELTSQPLISALKESLSLKRSAMFVMAATSHVPISPYCERAAASFETQRLMAFCKLSVVLNVYCMFAFSGQESITVQISIDGEVGRNDQTRCLSMLP